MFLGVYNTVFLNISYYLAHLKLRSRSFQIVVLTNFAVIPNVGINRFDCSSERDEKVHFEILKPRHYGNIPIQLNTFFHGSINSNFQMTFFLFIIQT